MISYELATKLKTAGFESEQVFPAYCNHCQVIWYSDDGLNPCKCEPDDVEAEEMTYIPTLEELIDACGEKFYGLYRKSKTSWIAIEPGKTTNREWMAGMKHSPSPEEAVANLWLELNKKA